LAYTVIYTSVCHMYGILFMLVSIPCPSLKTIFMGGMWGGNIP